MKPLWEYDHVHEYLEWCKKAFTGLKADPNAYVKTNWAGPRLDFEGLRREFVKALNKRINLKSGLVETRKWDSDYQRHLYRDQRIINDAARRCRHGGSGPSTPELRKRFPQVVDFCMGRDDEW